MYNRRGNFRSFLRFNELACGLEEKGLKKLVAGTPSDLVGVKVESPGDTRSWEKGVVDAQEEGVGVFCLF